MSLQPQCKIDEAEHLIHPWLVHALLSDFELEDVWRLPLKLSNEHSLHLFLEQLNQSTGQGRIRGLAGLLFRFRIFIGKLLGWDKKPQQGRLIPGSIRERYALSNELKYSDLPAPGAGDFVPVYQLENEFLSEIENKTVHAALHFSRVQMEPEVWGIQMAIYVKPKGHLGRVYMSLIKPFRLWVVYPALMKSARKTWKAFLESDKSDVSRPEFK